MTAKQLEIALNQKGFRDIGKQEAQILSVSHVIKGGDTLTYCPDENHVYIKLTYQKRDLPASVVNRELQKKVDEIKSTEQRNVSKKERTELKDNIVCELLPRAFVKFKNVFVLVSLKERRLFVDTASAGSADDITSLMRECLGSLSITPIQNKLDIKARLTNWVHTAPKDFELLENISFEAAGDKTTNLKLKNLSLTSQQVEDYIAEGMLINSLRVSHDKALECTITQNGIIKSLKFADNEGAQNQEDELAVLQADLFYNANLINKLFNRLEAEFKVEPAQ